jgi:UDP-2,4-diacetamido-2,4,6-trideoxy-beta-L-altropyranose hydrolase
VLLGPRFALLRREFAPWRDWKRTNPQVAQRVLVTMGGSDPANVTRRVVEAILSLPQLEATVVVGGSNPHLAELRQLAGAGNSKLQILENATNMAELMAAADVAVSAAGTTSWELCLLGLPAILIDVAENQRALAQTLVKRGCAIHLGSLLEVSSKSVASQLELLIYSPEARLSLSNCGRGLLDDNGAERIVAIMRSRTDNRLAD